MDIFSKKEEGLVINLDNISKTYLSDVADRIISNVMDGDADPLKEYIKAKGLSELSSQILDGLKDEAIREAEKYENDAVVSGCKVQIKNTPTTYDFSHNDEWALLNAQLDSVKKQMKQIEQKMLDAMKYAEVIDDRTGEVIPPAIVKKEGSQTIAITIPV